MSPAEVVELDRDHIDDAWPVMSQLRTHLSPSQFHEVAAEMMDSGYRLFAVRADAAIVAVAGVSIGLNLYYGRYMWVYDLVTVEGSRSRGHGRMLLAALERVARTEGCEMIALSSALHRTDAHRFYEGPGGFERVSYTFRKRLGPRVIGSP